MATVEPNRPDRHRGRADVRDARGTAGARPCRRPARPSSTKPRPPKPTTSRCRSKARTTGSTRAGGFSVLGMCETPSSGPSALCGATGVTEIQIFLHDDDDSVTIDKSVAVAGQPRILAEGGSGMDRLAGGDGPESLCGGPETTSSTVVAATTASTSPAVDAQGSDARGRQLHRRAGRRSAQRRSRPCTAGGRQVDRRRRDGHRRLQPADGASRDRARRCSRTTARLARATTWRRTSRR